MKKTMAMLLALLLVAVMLPVTAMAEDVTQVGTYSEFKAAVDAGKSVKFTADISGNGLVVASGNNLVIDLGGFTYTIDGTTVGSSGTETNGMQLLQGSTITIKNGKITSQKAQILIQNYCNLTLDGVTLDGSSLRGYGPYTLSNNNGDIVITGNTNIIAKTGGVAFDVCRYASYTGPQVTVTGNSVINGKVEISSSGHKENAQHKLIVEEGTFNGDIVKYGTSPDFESNISGGTFASNVTEYAGNNLVVTNGTNYYVGAAANSAVANATSGTTLTVVNGTDVVLTNVPGGVTINNETNDPIMVNGKQVSNDGSYTAPITIIVHSEGGSTTTTPSTDTTKNPSTGANDFVGVAAALAVVSVLGAAVAVRKK